MQGNSRNLFKKPRLCFWAQTIGADAYISQVSFLALEEFCSDTVFQEPCWCPKGAWTACFFCVTPFLPSYAALYLFFSTAPWASEEHRSLQGSLSSCLTVAGAKDRQFLGIVCVIISLQFSIFMLLCHSTIAGINKWNTITVYIKEK